MSTLGHSLYLEAARWGQAGTSEGEHLVQCHPRGPESHRSATSQGAALQRKSGSNTSLQPGIGVTQDSALFLDAIGVLRNLFLICK